MSWISRQSPATWLWPALLAAAVAGSGSLGSDSLGPDSLGDRARTELRESWVEARVSGRPLPALSAGDPGLSVEQAYALQAEVEARLLAQGDRRVGYKLGFTSADSQRRFGVAGPVRGFLLASMSAPEGGIVSTSGFSRIFAEAEIAFRMGRRVDHAVVDPESLRPYVSSVHPALELADYRFAADAAPVAVDFVADGVGARRFVLGPGRDPAGIDLARSSAVLERDGEVVGRGVGSDALGDPWRALAWLANELVAHGRSLEPGDVVLTGALGPVQVFHPPTTPARLRVRIEGLGEVEAGLAAGP